jgi:RNA polymerase sigma-70 factor (ECF subfamily)
LELAEKQREALALCVQALSERHRRVVEMHYHEGMSVEAIAEEIDRKKNAVSQLLFRIRQILRECVRKQFASTPA